MTFRRLLRAPQGAGGRAGRDYAALAGDAHRDALFLVLGIVLAVELAGAIVDRARDIGVAFRRARSQRRGRQDDGNYDAHIGRSNREPSLKKPRRRPSAVAKTNPQGRAIELIECYKTLDSRA